MPVKLAFSDIARAVALPVVNSRREVRWWRGDQSVCEGLLPLSVPMHIAWLLDLSLTSAHTPGIQSHLIIRRARRGPPPLAHPTCPDVYTVRAYLPATLMLALTPDTSSPCSPPTSVGAGHPSVAAQSWKRRCRSWKASSPSSPPSSAQCTSRSACSATDQWTSTHAAPFARAHTTCVQ